VDVTRTPILGIVTIGQTPRPDLERAFRAHAEGAHIILAGALDGMPPGDIEIAAARPTDYPLLVRLSDGSTRELPLEVIHPLVAQRARELVALGARVVAVACAGGFPDIDCDVPMLLPGRILPAVVSALSRPRRIGVVAPMREQAPAALRKWSNDGFDPVVTWAAPDAEDEIEAAITRMSDPSLALVVLDCFGHDEAYAREFARRTGHLVIAAQTVTARLAGELVRN
jgi:protein AroM